MEYSYLRDFDITDIVFKLPDIFRQWFDPIDATGDLGWHKREKFFAQSGMFKLLRPETEITDQILNW